MDLNIYVLPHLNALLNATSAVFLITGYLLIRSGHQAAHKRCMIAALSCSAAFLTSYVIYHLHAGSRPFTGTGAIRGIYFAILITHVVLAAVILPLVLMTATRGLRSQFDRHVRIARWTLPLWLYVSVTGVIVYLMLYQLYLIAVFLVSSFAIPAVQAQASAITSTGSTGLPGIPLATPVTIHPRLISAYAALLAAAMLSLLYLYRGRSFVVYWIGSWLLVAAGLGIVARSYSDPTLGSVLTGLALLFTVSAAGLMRLSVESFPQHPVRWDGRRITAMSAAALWFLVAPFAAPLSTVILTGTLATAGLLAWSGVGYLHLARQVRSAGALVMGIGLTLIASSHLFASVMSLFMDLGPGQRLSAVTVITTLFVALGMHILVFEDMTDELRLANRRLAGANEEVRRLAITDALTGCHNRRFFDEVERREIERHRRYGTPLSVVFIDVNRFKRLNDTLGHDRGDAVLWMIGNLLKGQVRQSDYAIRWGGDEFLLLLSCGVEEAKTKAASLKAAFDQERVGAALPPYLGISVGVAPVSPEEGLRAAIREADSQMYGDKISESGV